MNKIAPLLLLSTTCFFWGCTLGPDYEKPATELPKSWNSSPETAQTILCSPWWLDFKEPLLNTLIDEALKANANLLLAMARISEARAMLSVREADFLPEINLTSTALRATSNSLGVPTSSSNINTFFGFAGLLSYEIDLWGRLARAEESARAQMLSKIYAKEAVQLTISADVALTYFTLQALYAQRTITEKTISAWEQSYTLQKERYKGGYITQLDLLQTETQLDSAKAKLPAIQQEIAEQVNGLAVLLGRTPKELVEKMIPQGRPLDQETLPSIPLSTPTTLFEQRPDIRAAEQELIAANAEIGVVKAAYFPTLSLAALGGLSSNQLNQLFKGSSKQWQIGGNFAGPLITFGRAEGSVEAAEAVKEEALVSYQQTIREAFKEVLNALSSQKTSTARFKAENDAVNAQRKMVDLSKDRYKSGYTNYLDLLDAERSLFQAQLNLTSAQLDRFRSVVDLYKALGGPAFGKKAESHALQHFL